MLFKAIQQRAAEYGTEVLVAEGNTYLGRIIIADEARPDFR